MLPQPLHLDHLLHLAFSGSLRWLSPDHLDPTVEWITSADDEPEAGDLIVVERAGECSSLFQNAIARMASGILIVGELTLPLGEIPPGLAVAQVSARRQQLGVALSLLSR